MSESILPISADLWLNIDTAELANDGLFKLCSSSSGDVLIDKEEVPALISALHKFLDEYGGPKEVQH